MVVRLILTIAAWRRHFNRCVSVQRILQGCGCMSRAPTSPDPGSCRDSKRVHSHTETRPPVYTDNCKNTLTVTDAGKIRLSSGTCILWLLVLEMCCYIFVNVTTADFKSLSLRSIEEQLNAIVFPIVYGK